MRCVEPEAEVQLPVDQAEAVTDTSLHDDDVEEEEETPAVTGPNTLLACLHATYCFENEAEMSEKSPADTADKHACLQRCRWRKHST